MGWRNERGQYKKRVGKYEGRLRMVPGGWNAYICDMSLQPIKIVCSCGGFTDARSASVWANDKLDELNREES